MQNDTTNPTGSPQAQGNAMLKALVAIAVKAGSTDVALPPEGGWPAAIGMPLRSWQRSVRSLEAAGLVEQIDGVLLLRQALTQEDIEDGERFVRLPEAMARVDVPPDALRAWVAVLSLADHRTGQGRAHLPAIARRMGRTKAAGCRALAKLEPLGIFHRTGSRSWTIATAPRGSRHGMVALNTLRQHFDFDRETLETNMENVVMFPSTATKNSADYAEFSRQPRNDDAPTTQRSAPYTQRNAPTTQRDLSTSPIHDPLPGTNATASAGADADTLAPAEAIMPLPTGWTAADLQRLFRKAS